MNKKILIALACFFSLMAFLLPSLSVLVLTRLLLAIMMTSLFYLMVLLMNTLIHQLMKHKNLPLTILNLIRHQMYVKRLKQVPKSLQN